ncbi:MAG: hypothetical protein Q9227_008518 [Pyrenula ochraceoflavens]
MGDQGKLYVHESVVPAYKELLPHADLILPNQFEADPRLFRITIPALPCFFSGTGDMFAALLIARLRQFCAEAKLLQSASWMPDDEVPAVDLPLAKATEMVLASMQTILEKTIEARDKELEVMKSDIGRRMDVDGEQDNEDDGDEAERNRMHLAQTKAGEVRVVRNVRDLVEPDLRNGTYKAQSLEKVGDESGV